VCGRRVSVKSTRCPHGQRSGVELDLGLDGDGRGERSGLGRTRRWCRRPARCWCCVPTMSVMPSLHGLLAQPCEHYWASGSEPAEQLPLHLRRPIKTVVVERPSGAMGQGQGSLPSVIVEGSRTGQTNYHRSAVALAGRAPPVHDQIRVWPAGQMGTDGLNVPRRSAGR
jgi:hypothetical protein